MQKYAHILRHARAHRLSLFFLLLLSGLGAGVSALQPWPLKILADQILQQQPLPPAIGSLLRHLGMSADLRTVLLLAAAALLLFHAISSIIDAVVTTAWTWLGRSMVYALGQELFSALQKRSLTFHARTSVGDSLSRVTGDNWCVYQVVDSMLFAPLHAAVVSAAMIFLMLQLDGQLTLLALVTAPAMAAVSMLAGKRLRAAAREKRELESNLNAHIQQTLAGIPVVQAFAQEEREQRRFREFTSASIRVQQRTVLLGSLSGLASGLVLTIGSGLLLWVGAYRVLQGAATVGSLLIFVSYLNKLQEQFKVFAGVYNSLQGLSANVSRVNAVLDAQPEVREREGAMPLPAIQRGIVFENVSAGYDTGLPVLQDISLEIKPGQTVALVGATGAGKSTMAALIPRFIDPWKGRVLVDGHDLREVRLSDLRSKVAVLLQEPYLFPFTVAENIAYGRPGATRTEIEAAATAARAHDFIIQLPRGYDTELGERGATLSGGQRQRLAIARALLKDAPILILDEPTSALDVDTEALLMEAITRLMQGRTVLMIAHRLSTIRHADLIVVLEKGQIVERGPHRELIANQGRYARLHHLQLQSEPTLSP